MALEVDALVRSIENEKVEEEDREKVSPTRLLQGSCPLLTSVFDPQARDALARIDGIRDKVRYISALATTLAVQLTSDVDRL